ncbi:putative Myo-inositol catabolism protein [metagenome]|uniref:Putative Myo-inositol catabolism protein n=1 Tax=metagenome TaxID=256318 RepID=A0A2P2C3Y5_9ZZZZ
MASQSTQFGVELVTFFHPSFWDVPDGAGIMELGRRDPRAFWEKLLDAVAAAGVTDLELTFAPTDYTTAIAAFGSTAGFAGALSARGLRVHSHFLASLAHASDPSDGAVQRSILADARSQAEFLTEIGGEFLVMGLPSRRTTGSVPTSFVDLATAGPIADLVNLIGAETVQHGVTTLLHTESHSMLWTPRDVDLFMLLTDPMYVGLCPDAGHLALGGCNPVDVLQRHRGRVRLAHWKDASGPVPAGMTIDETIYQRQGAYFRSPGHGVVDWAAWSRELASSGYEGPVLLEIDAAERPVEVLSAAREFLTGRLLGLASGDR